MKRRQAGLSFGLVLSISCGSVACDGSEKKDTLEEEEDETTGMDASVSDAAASATFANSECGVCFAEVCHDHVQACLAQPDCAKYVACMNRCGNDEQGGLQADCDQACRTSSGTAELLLAQALADCRSGQAAALCDACGERMRHPVLSQSCMESPETKPCWKCEDERCCDTYQACADDAECQAFKTCLVSCAASAPSDAGVPSDATPGEHYAHCAHYCLGLHPSAVTTWAPRETCIFTLCAEECSDVPIDSCTSCMNANCADLSAQLHSTPEGYLLSNCVARCPDQDTDCFSACLETYPDQQDELERVNVCSTQRCEVCAAPSARLSTGMR